MKKLLVLTFLFLIVPSVQIVLPQVAKAEYYHKVITVEDRFVRGGESYPLVVVAKQKEYFTTYNVPYAFLKPNRTCKVQIESFYNEITDVYQCYN